MVTLTETQLRQLIKESVFETLNGFNEERHKNSEGDEKKHHHHHDDSDYKEKKLSRKEKYEKENKPKKNKKGGLASQAKQELKDTKLNNAEVVRQLEDEGFLSGDEDTDRSWLSKIARGLRDMPSGMAAAIMNITTSDD